MTLSELQTLISWADKLPVDGWTAHKRVLSARITDQQLRLEMSPDEVTLSTENWSWKVHIPIEDGDVQTAFEVAKMDLRDKLSETMEAL